MPRPWLPRSARRALIATITLLLAAGGIARVHIGSGAWGAISIGLLISALIMLLLFFRVELIAAAMISVTLSVAATLGIMGWLGTPTIQSDRLLAILLLAPSTILSICVLSGELRRYRNRPANPIGALALAIVAAAFVLLPPRSATVETTELVAVISSLTATLLVLPAMARYLLPCDADRQAPALGSFARDDVRRPVRSLYAYLDIPAEQYVAWKLRLDPIFSRIDAAVPTAGEIFDAGCGFGIMSHLLAVRSARRNILGVDLDEDKLRIARCAGRTIKNARFVRGDLLDFDYPSSDCVLLIDVLHYWTPQKQAQIIARCAACLRPAGTLVFREGLRSDGLSHRLVDWLERWAVLLGHNPRGDGLRFQTREFYVEEFARRGLRLIGEAPDWGRGSNTVLLLRKRGE